YKINRAADDAAGLSISEKMRRQIRGLTQASLNAQDGISCVQTAEGALNEVHDMLQRMNELAVKGENGTLSSVDQSYIQAEIKQLMTEIDRVADTTTFNEQNLLDGSFKNKGLQVGAEAGQHIDISITSMSLKNLASKATAANISWKEQMSVGKAATMAKADVKSAAMTALVSVAVAEKYGNVKAGDVLNANQIKEISSKYGATRVSVSVSVKAEDVVARFQTKYDSTNPNTYATTRDFASLNAFVKHALQTVSLQRSDLGAIQNRLEHTIANLDNVVENTTSAESAIRDTDMATTMVRYANNQILAQAGTAMLAQSNQSNQGVLSLLG
ncbi:MAG: flagellin, partial [Clostridium sp.]|nr:flagellin [Clostridium sp.]